MDDKKKTNSHTSSVNDYRQQVIERLSQGSLRVHQDAQQGAFVLAKQSLYPDQVLLECPSASIALDPTYRQSHCGYCASPCSRIATLEEVPTNACCQSCHILSICAGCRQKGAEQWHTQNGECSVLKSLVESFRELFSEFEGLSMPDAALQVESIYILTVRLLFRRQLDQQKDPKRPIHCPLPEIDWALFDTLYGSPLPSSESGSFVAAMASLFQLMSLKVQKNSATASNGVRALDPQECVRIWSKCRGCSYAITDLTRPLGAQNLGMALFVPQSFFNHGCAPNAFLSCLLAGENNTASKNRPCAVMSRVVCCTTKNTVSQGESVTLSYIPLSGLCYRERQVRSKELYHFECTCQVCQEAATPSSDGHALEKAVGGEFSAALSHDNDLDTLTPLRELQISCHQQLMTASTMNVASHSASTNHSEENDDEDDPRTDLIEQSIATLEMAQRGIRNQKLPPSHEVSLECHRLLAMAYALLRQDSTRTGEDDFDKEVHHHEQFFQNVAPIMRIFDPSTLMIQHLQMTKCLQYHLQEDAGEKHSNGTGEGSVFAKYRYHLQAIRELATRALGMDHPFVLSLQLQGRAEDELKPDSYDAKKRKLNAK